jgi:outer membrane protein assembly factor BamE
LEADALSIILSAQSDHQPDPERQRMTKRPRIIYQALKALTLGALCLLAGCVYRINIQQGNFLKPEDVDRVQTGMTRSQVRFLLGTPLVSDTFDTDRWDYYYYLVKGHSRKKETRHVVVQFEGDKVVRIERLKMPAGTAPVAAPAAPDTPAPADAAAKT